MALAVILLAVTFLVVDPMLARVGILWRLWVLPLALTLGLACVPPFYEQFVGVMEGSANIIVSVGGMITGPVFIGMAVFAAVVDPDVLSCLGPIGTIVGSARRSLFCL